jgi:DNA-directed RNA polymerase subunit N (RpoN/RPB10)
MPIVPICCFTCGEYISDFGDAWAKHHAEHGLKPIKDQEKANLKFFETLEFKVSLTRGYKMKLRYCCRNNLDNAAIILERLKRKAVPPPRKKS